jgi:hypothetical protein
MFTLNPGIWLLMLDFLETSNMECWFAAKFGMTLLDDEMTSCREISESKDDDSSPKKCFLDN